jgi:large repetitive protein
MPRVMPVSRNATLLVTALALLVPGAASASAPPAAPGQLIVKFAPGAGPSDRQAARDDAGVAVKDVLPVAGLQLVKTDPGRSTAAAAAALERSPDVVYAEPNLYRSASVTPNDPYFSYLWGANSASDADMDLPEAWDITTGSPSVTAAVIDTGIDATHPDLASRVWSNPGETGSGRETNGLDDDGDGFVDDAHGWDFVQDDNDPADENEHGTHVSGTIAAAGNNGTGITGVSWNSRIMPVRVLDANGSGTVADLISAYHYATARGVKVINLSLGGSGYSSAEANAISSAPDTLFVVAAGNGGSDQVGDDVETTPEYPCAYPLPNVVCVAASNTSDGRPSFSNYGATSVDLAAPGEDILSTVPGNGYAYLSGTSMATPQVTGAAALILSARPSSTVAQVKEDLLAGVDQRAAFAGKTVTGGRLNANRSLLQAGATPPADPPPAAPGGATTVAPAPLPTRTTAPLDLTAPRVYLRVARRIKLSSLRAHGMRLRVRCSEGCSARGRLYVRSSGASGTRTRLVGTARLKRSPLGRRMTVRLSRTGKRLLKRSRAKRLTLEVRVTDAAANARRVHVRIALKR